MNLINPSMRAALVVDDRDFAYATDALVPNAAMPQARPRTTWSATATAGWTGAQAPATRVTEAFSAHRVSLKQSWLPREDLWLT
jgi:hypothetical protein